MEQNSHGLVYKSQQCDDQLRLISFRTSVCNIKYYESHDLSKLDIVICNLLNENNGGATLVDLAYTLGFDVIYNPELDSYRDDAEIEMFLHIVKSVFDWGLVAISLYDINGKTITFPNTKYAENIDVTKSYIKLTNLGRKSLSLNKKFCFFESKVDRLSFFNLRNKNDKEIIQFPYLSELGARAKLYSTGKIDYSDDLVQFLDSINETNLIAELKTQLPDGIIVYDALDTGYLGSTKTLLDVELYSIDGNYELKFYHNGYDCECLNQLYGLKGNSTAKENKVEWSLYCKLLHDESAVLGFENLSPFEDLISFNQIIPDHRINWADKRLLQFIINHCDADGWHLLSNHCDSAILETLCDAYKDSLDWSCLTLRLSDNFLLENSKKFPWEKELLVVRNDVSSTLLEHFLLESFSNNYDIETVNDWDWDNLLPLLSRSFIVSHINEIPFDLTSLTKEINESEYSLITSNAQAFWDWEYISSSFPINFLVKEINILWSKINHKVLIERIFFSHEDYNISLESLKSLLYESSDIEKASFGLNTKDADWTNEQISFFESTGLITWESTAHKRGFELNTSLNWEFDFFAKYNNRISTQCGFSHVSKEIQEISIVDAFPNFNWDWDVLSSRRDVANNSEFVERNISRLNKSTIAQICDSELLEKYFSLLSLEDLMRDNMVISQRFTQSASIDFLRSHISLPWNWIDVTKRVYPILKLESIGNLLWVDKWDWDFLSENIDLSKILDFASEYLKYWNWDIIINRLSPEFVFEKNNIEIIASAISSHQLAEKLWTSLTDKFDSETILTLFSKFPDDRYSWDIGVIYNRDDFDVRKHIENNPSLIDWVKLSSSAAVNNLFSKLKKKSTKSLWLRELRQLLISYKCNWDYHSLTRLENILNSPNLFDLELDWDWDYISAHAKWISVSKETGNTYFFRQYQSKLSFSILSSRDDIGLTEEIILKYKNADWDWDALIINSSISFSFDFIIKHEALSWNWKELSLRKDLLNDTIITLKDKDWDWYIISSNNNFIPSIQILDELTAKNIDLNWRAISKSQYLSYEIVSSYWANLYIYDVIDKHENFNELLPPELIMKHSKSFPWDFYNQNIGNQITMKMVEIMGEFLDWSNVSNSQLLSFSPDFLRKYEAKWYWTILSNNPKVKEQIPSFNLLFAKQIKTASFIQRIKQVQNHPCIYHFTHLYNAIDVIKSRKILSRDRALELGLLKFDSAGSVIGRSTKAHSFARFYFRPGTPTQYYNEALGADSKLGTYNRRNEWKSKYPQARNLGLPKCPLPVFFKFDLEEVISAMPELCYYSDRNMQSDNPTIYAVVKNVDKLCVDYLYSTQQDAFHEACLYNPFAHDVYMREFNNFKKYSQQEFLIKSEFDFSQLHSFKIICYSEECVEILKSILGDDPICNKIEYSRNVFEYENRHVEFTLTPHIGTIETDFQDNYQFSIRGKQLNEIKFDFSYDDTYILRESNDEIVIKGKFSWENTLSPFAVYFYDPSARTKEWLIFKNSPSEIIESSRLVLDPQLKNCISKFTEFIQSLPIQISSDLFYPHMLNSFHGISHTYRVLFNSFILAFLSNAEPTDLIACGIAAIIHDLGKRDDREGQVHGANSVQRCGDLVKLCVHDSKRYDEIMSAVKYHSIPDEATPDEIKNNIIWKILKDADALDRSRFNGKGCDRSYLRLPIFDTEEGLRIIELTSFLPGWTSHLQWDNPTAEFINTLYKFVK